MILVKTEVGQQVLKDRSVQLTPRQRSAFILFDGKRSVDEVIASGMGIGSEDIDHLIQSGLLVPAPLAGGQAPAATGEGGSPPRSTPAPAPESAAPTGSTRSHQQRYKDAYPIATQLTASLGLRGFRLNLAVEGTSTYEELQALLPKIQAAVGVDKAVALEQALGGN